MFVSWRMDAGNWTRVLCESRQCWFLSTEPSPLFHSSFLTFLKWLLSKTGGCFFLRHCHPEARSPFCFHKEWTHQLGHSPELQQSQPPQPADAASTSQSTIDLKYLKELHLCWTWIDLFCLWFLKCIAQKLFILCLYCIRSHKCL